MMRTILTFVVHVYLVAILSQVHPSWAAADFIHTDVSADIGTIHWIVAIYRRQNEILHNVACTLVN